MEGTGKWAIIRKHNRKDKYSRAHVWVEHIGRTMCGMQGSKYEIVSERGEHKVCTMCQSNYLLILNESISQRQ